MLAGVNGAGKSSVAGARLLKAGGQFYNPDLYARQLQIAPPGLSIDARAELVLGRDHHLGGRRGGWRPQVGDEVGDREVGLVPDRRDDRDR